MADFDVIVIGGGGAGLAAAIEALDAGAHVLVCEKAQRIGGSTANSGGVIMAAGSDVQRERGVEDSVDALFEHYMTHNKYLVEAGLARTLCEGGQETLDWLRGFGVRFDPDALYVTGVENPATPRGHPAEGNGHAIMVALENAAMSRGLEVAVNTRVAGVLRDEGGHVEGIFADGVKVTASSVVVTTGGFGNDFELLESWFPNAARHGQDWHFYVGIDENTGDGHRLAQAAGAAIVGQGFGQALLTAKFSKEPEPYIPGWLVYVNCEGRRFVNETGAYVIMDHVVNAQAGGRCWAIMDHAAFSRDDMNPRYRTPEFLIFPTPNWQPEALARHLEHGAIYKGETLGDLARQAGIAPVVLASTIAQYNEAAKLGFDPHYLKDKRYLLPVAQPPWYAIELRPAGVGSTHAGLRIDTQARVYDTGGEPIPGLFAAGECTGGVMAHYVGGGNSLLNNFVFGRVAGRNAAECAMGSKITPT